MGGTCVIRGCVPKKLMVFASGYRRADRRTPRTTAGTLARAASTGRGSAAGCTRNSTGWRVYRGPADNGRGRDPRPPRDGGRPAHGARWPTATRSRPSTSWSPPAASRCVPDVPGARAGDRSNEMFHLETLPKRMLVVGGGYIACEFACILNGLGVEVTQYYRGAQILRGFDDEARGLVAEGMRAAAASTSMSAPRSWRSRRPATGSAVKGIARPRETLRRGALRHRAHAEQPRPGAGGGGREARPPRRGRGRRVQPDRVPSIYAVGDVTDRINLTPVAIREGMAFAETVFSGNPTPVDHELVAWAVFTQPEIGSVGLTEEEARDRGAIEVYCTSFRPMQHGLHRPDRPGADEADRRCRRRRRVLGCHIVADGAGEMIQMAAIAIKMGATKEDFDRTVRGASDDVRRTGDHAQAGAHSLNSARGRDQAGMAKARGTGDGSNNGGPWGGGAAEARRGRRRRRQDRGRGGRGVPAASGRRSPRSTRSMRKGQEQLRVLMGGRGSAPAGGERRRRRAAADARRPSGWACWRCWSSGLRLASTP